MGISVTVGVLGFSCNCGEPIHSLRTELYNCPKCGRQIDVKIQGGSGHLIIEVDRDPEENEVNALKKRLDHDKPSL